MEDGALAQLMKMVGGCSGQPTSPGPAMGPQTSRLPSSAKHNNGLAKPKTFPNTQPSTNLSYMPALVPNAARYGMLQLYFAQQLIQQKVYNDFLTMAALNQQATNLNSYATFKEFDSKPTQQADPLLSLYDMVKVNSSVSQPDVPATKTFEEHEIKPDQQMPALTASVSARASSFTIDELLQSDNLDDTRRSSSAEGVRKGGISKSRIAQRKKHIEFHRRMKGINARSKITQCQICSQVVNNNSSDITNHVYSHADSSLFACCFCAEKFQQKVSLYTHNKTVHSNENPDLLTDLRDMTVLCDLLDRCFPRSTKLVIDNVIQNLVSAVKDVSELRCKLCSKKVAANVASVKNHLTQHPRFKCKTCLFSAEKEETMISHGKEQHGSGGCSYNASAATVVLSTILSACFADYLTPEGLEMANELTASTSPCSNPPVE